MTTRPGAPIRAFRRSFALSTALCALAATLGGSVSAAPARMTAVALPGTELGDQVITVAWSGFTPTRDDGTYGVMILQCRAHPKSVTNDCNTANTFPYDLTGNQQAGITHKDGTGNKFIDIMTTARLPSLACSESTPCSLLLYETTENGFDPAGLPPAKTRVLVPLTFKRNSADCPPVKQYNFSIESETSATPALYQAAAALCIGKYPFTMAITNTSSNQAREDFFSGEADLAVTSLPPERAEIPATPPAFSVTPIDLTGIAIAYNIVDPVTNKQITDLTLSPRLVARLLSDSDIQTFFQDPELKKLNPHHHWPSEAADPGLRGDKNADTWIVTNWINGNPGARAFLDGHDHYGVPVNVSWKHVHYPTDVFAARNSNGVYFPRIGEEGVAQRLFANTKPADSVPTDPLNAGEIGILDLPTAEQFKLPVANLTNGVGQPVVTANAWTIAAAYQGMLASRAGFHREPAVVRARNVYPLAKVDQAMVPKKLTTSNKDLRIRALLDYAVGPLQDDLPPGYVPLPMSLRLQTLHYTGDPLQTTSTSTTTTTLPTPLYPQGLPGDSYVSPPPVDTPTIPSTVTTPPPTRGATTTTAPTTTTRPATAKLVALRLPDSGDHLVLPLVLGVGLVAVLAASVDELRRYGRRLWRRNQGDKPAAASGGAPAP